MEMNDNIAAQQRAKESSDLLKARLRGSVESKTKNTLNNAKVGGTPATPALRMKSLANDKHGYLQAEFEEPPAKSLQTKEYYDQKTGKNRIATFDPATGDFLQTPADPVAAAPQSSVDTSIGLMKVFIDRPEVKEYVTIQGQVAAMDALWKQRNPNSNLALDQGLISMFNKITDPNSVVRESEYERTPQNIATINRAEGTLRRIREGGAGITDTDRQVLVQAAKVIANSKGKLYDETRKRYGDFARRKELDPDMITGTTPEYAPFDITIDTPGKIVEGKTSTGQAYKVKIR
jgi:hypothetical protein